MSAKFNIVKKFYDKKLWSIGRVENAVKMKWITVAEFETITGEKYNKEGEKV